MGGERDHTAIDRRELLGHLGAAGVGAGAIPALSGRTTAAEAAPEMDLEAAVTRIVDNASGDMSRWVEEAFEEVFEAIRENVDEKYRQWPWDFCNEYDLWADGKRLCVGTSDPPAYPQELRTCGNRWYAPDVWHVGMNVSLADKGFWGWSELLSLDSWIGFGSDGCLYAGSDDGDLGDASVANCNRVDCVWSGLNPGSTNPVERGMGYVADVAYEIATNAIQVVADRYDLPRWAVWTLTLVIALVLVVGAWYAAVAIAGSGGAAVLPALAVAGEVGLTLGEAIA